MRQRWHNDKGAGPNASEDIGRIDNNSSILDMVACMASQINFVTKEEKKIELSMPREEICCSKFEEMVRW